MTSRPKKRGRPPAYELSRRAEMLGLLQDELAARLGVCVQTLRKWIRERKPVLAELLQAWEMLGGVPDEDGKR